MSSKKSSVTLVSLFLTEEVARLVEKSVKNEAERRRAKLADLLRRAGGRKSTDPTQEQVELMQLEAQTLDRIAQEICESLGKP